MFKTFKTKKVKGIDWGNDSAAAWTFTVQKDGAQANDGVLRAQRASTSESVEVHFRAPGTGGDGGSTDASNDGGGGGGGGGASGEASEWELVLWDEAGKDLTAERRKLPHVSPLARLVAAASGKSAENDAFETFDQDDAKEHLFAWLSLVDGAEAQGNATELAESNRGKLVRIEVPKGEDPAYSAVPNIITADKIVAGVLPLQPLYPTPIRALPADDVRVFEGPTDDETNEPVCDALLNCWGDLVACKTVSTYPYHEKKKRRDGDPVADQYSICMAHRNRLIMTVCDGCNWGVSVREAAARAAHASTTYLTKHAPLMDDLHTAGEFIRRSIEVGHAAISEGKPSGAKIGTTTIISGVLWELDPVQQRDKFGRAPPPPPRKATAAYSFTPVDADEISLAAGEAVEVVKQHPTGWWTGRNSKGDFGHFPGAYVKFASDIAADSASPRAPRDDGREWAFITAFAGDCKAFTWNCRTGESHDITEMNREGTKSASDSGGRIGPTLGDMPDIRNFSVEYAKLRPGDLLIVCSDGVHDNLDPAMLGLEPGDIDDVLAKHGADWNFEGNQPIRAEHRQRTLNKLIAAVGDNAHDKHPARVSEALLKYCIDVNANAVEFMMTNPNKKLPQDLKLYPGKMDHTTCCVFKVPEFEFRK